MAITISSAFDAGNIRVVSQDGDTAELEIVKDHMSDFYQWFHFRLAGAAGREVVLRITNCAGSAYPKGWPDSRPWEGVRAPRRPRSVTPCPASRHWGARLCSCWF